MSSQIQELQVADEGRFELAAIVAALSAEYELATGVKRHVRRRRLDTFDRRLHEAGLTLEHRAFAPGKLLKLGRRRGSSVAILLAHRVWPEPADVLPAPVRDVVATVTGIGTLVVTSDKMQRVQRLELANQDGKTVARVQLNEPASVAPARLTARRFQWLLLTAARA